MMWSSFLTNDGVFMEYIIGGMKGTEFYGGNSRVLKAESTTTCGGTKINQNGIRGQLWSNADSAENKKAAEENRDGLWRDLETRI